MLPHLENKACSPMCQDITVIVAPHLLLSFHPSKGNIDPEASPTLACPYEVYPYAIFPIR
jgi:hypothetical protein